MTEDAPERARSHPRDPEPGSLPRTLRIDRRVLDSVRAHGRREYPRECCGVLVGCREAREVRGAVPGRNLHPEARGRFLLDPRDLLEAHREARRRGAEIVGFYHSHPDRPARPSATDADAAWPACSQLILSVLRGVPAEVGSWRFEGGVFQAEPLEEVLVPLG